MIAWMGDEFGGILGIVFGERVRLFRGSSVDLLGCMVGGFVAWCFCDLGYKEEAAVLQLTMQIDGKD